MKNNIVLKCVKCPGDCCKFTIIKTRSKDLIVKKKGHITILYTTYYPRLDPFYFKQFGIMLVQNKKHRRTCFVFETPSPIFKKTVDGLLWLKIPIPCQKLNSHGKCKIYRNRPKACKINGCPYDEKVDKWFKWEKQL